MKRPKPETRNKKSGNDNGRFHREGIALLMVLFIIMAATILSLGFLSRSDTELACGDNMILRTQMDYLAESGLEYARGLVINDSNLPANWTANRRQLCSGGDYYNVSVSRLNSPHDPNQPHSFGITATAYREKSGRRIGSSVLVAKLYVHPSNGLFYYKSIERQ